jgi:hypothetical protein
MNEPVIPFPLVSCPPQSWVLESINQERECSHELRVSITQAHPAHRLKRQQLGEADVSAPQFDLFFYRQVP